MTHEWRLRPDDRPGAPDALHGTPDNRGLEFAWMRKVRHQRKVTPARHHPLKQAQQVVGVRISDEPVRPEGQRFRAKPDLADMIELMREQRLDAGMQVRRAHDQRIPAREQDVRDLRVPPQVLVEGLRRALREPQALHADELRPAEAVGAVGMARLAAPRKEQHRFAILVLHTLKGSAIEARHVVLELAGGCGFIRRRILSTTGRNSCAAAPASTSDATRSSSRGSSMPGWGKVSWKMGSFGTLLQSISSSTA